MPSVADYARQAVGERVERLRRMPDELAEAIAGQSDAILSQRPDGRNWSAKEIVCHLRDVVLGLDEPKILVLGAAPADLARWGIGGPVGHPLDPDRWAEERQYTHPKIAGVAIVAVPDARLQEQACAVVIPKPDETITLAEIVSFLDARELAKQKFPERLEIVSEFPMTPSGKIQTYRLRQLVGERLAAASRRLP